MTTDTPRNVDELEEVLSRPTAKVIEVLRQLDGDIILLGAGGKMGPTMARMIQRGFAEGGVQHKVIAVSRFSSTDARQDLEAREIETIAADLLDEDAVMELPDAPHVIAMSGFKFGTDKFAHLTWATNCLVPVNIARRYRDSRIAAFSTGNVYGMVPVTSRGSTESDPMRPDGEYPMAAVGRERMYHYLSEASNIPIALIRLNYATELRYGVIVDLCQDVLAGKPIDVRTGYVNVIWQAEANSMSIAALAHCDVPARPINLAGREILRTRDVCQRIAELAGCEVSFVGEESELAYLNDGSGGYALLGEPSVTGDQMIRWTVDWMTRGGETLGKPTHFQVRDGVF